MMAAERKIAAAESARTDSQVTARMDAISSTEMTSQTADDDAQLGAVFGGQYRIQERMGSGGMGAVYRGTQLSVDRPVAIKVIAPEIEQTAQHVQRFRREAEALAKLQHPNTVHLLDFGVTDEGRLYMVMELLSGMDLEAQMAQYGSVELAPALRIVRQIARSLSEAHALGVIHRDLKPSNVFLCHVEGGDSFVKVMDFGVAGFLREEDGRSALTMKGTVLGTAAYMSPEQAQGYAVDARADLYSLGVLLFEMIAGRTPFQANSAVSLLIAHVSEEPPRLADISPDIPEREAVQMLLDDLLAKDPAKRLASSTDLIERIDALLAELGEMPMVPAGHSLTPSRPLRAAKRRKRSGSAWPYLGMTMVLALAAAFVWQRPTEVASIRAMVGPQLESLQDRSVAMWASAKQVVGGLGRPATSRVTIATVPSGATVKLGGAELGSTPYELAVKDKMQIVLDLAGHETKTVEVDPAGEPNLVIKLTPLGPFR
jgi:serine/threonine protein kinase